MIRSRRNYQSIKQANIQAITFFLFFSTFAFVICCFLLVIYYAVYLVDVVRLDHRVEERVKVVQHVHYLHTITCIRPRSKHSTAYSIRQSARAEEQVRQTGQLPDQ